MKRILVLLLCACVLLSLCACGASGKETPGAAEETAAAEEKVAEEPVKEETAEEPAPPAEEGAEAESAEEPEAEPEEAEPEEAEPEEEEPGIPGLYRLVDHTGEGIENGAEQIAANEAEGDVFYIELREDGSACLNAYGQENDDGFWDEEVICFNDVRIPYTWEDGVLTLSNENETMVFRKSSRKEIDEFLRQVGKYVPSVKGSMTEDDLVQETFVLAEGDGFRVTLKGYTIDEFIGLGADVVCENDTDKNLLFQTGNTYINGYDSFSELDCECAPGEKNEGTIHFDMFVLDAYGIPSADEIEIVIRVTDADDWRIDPYLEETCVLHPTGKKEVPVPERAVKEGEQVLADNDGLAFVLYGADESNNIGCVLRCYLENKTDQVLSFLVTEASVNGFPINPYFAEDLPPGKRAYKDMYFNISDLEENGIDLKGKGIKSIEEIVFHMEAYTREATSEEGMVRFRYLLDETFTYRP